MKTKKNIKIKLTPIREDFTKSTSYNRVIEKSGKAEILGDIYKDINAIKIEATDSFDTLVKKFYKVMGKHGICQGTWSENGKGRLTDNPEWCMCWNTFKSNIEAKLTLFYLFSNPPKKLLAYGEQPKSK